MNFGEQIKKIRSDSGLTQEQFAAKLNVSRQSVSSWENNRNLPDLEMTVEIAKAFGLSLDQLILGGGDMADKLIRDGSETSRAKINRSILLIGTALLCVGAACLFLKGATVEYIGGDGFLHENFFLLPIGFLFLFGGAMTFAVLGVKNIAARFMKNRGDGSGRRSSH
ncbi:MAG: helix-turn-helix domain-containing protein [Oscillospiraceae bacterium]|nr:helix-turn-helix domain-containing protein [Oscillospiraceae bacterium]